MAARHARGIFRGRGVAVSSTFVWRMSIKAPYHSGERMCTCRPQCNTDQSERRLLSLGRGFPRVSRPRRRASRRVGGDVLLEAAYIRYNGPMEHQILQEKPASGWKTLVMAFGDVVRSPSWPVKMLQMGLVSVVPVFGAVVLNGYLLGWARDAAWGRTEPLPARLFGNEDGALYRRGWYAFVISLVYGLALALVYAACVSLSQSAFPAAVGQPAVLDLYAYAQQRVAIHPILLAVYYAASLVISPFMLVSMMRMSIYGRLGAGLQFGRVLAMVRKGLASIAVIVVVTALAEEAVSALSGPLSDAALSAQLDPLATFGTFAGLVAALALLAFVNAVSIRAAGLWTARFDVPRWKGYGDPLPFEEEGNDA